VLELPGCGSAPRGLSNPGLVGEVAAVGVEGRLIAGAVGDAVAPAEVDGAAGTLLVSAAPAARAFGGLEGKFQSTLILPAYV
jgi:hypothetical protein